MVSSTSTLVLSITILYFSSVLAVPLSYTSKDPQLAARHNSDGGSYYLEKRRGSSGGGKGKGKGKGKSSGGGGGGGKGRGSKLGQKLLSNAKSMLSKASKKASKKQMDLDIDLGELFKLPFTTTSTSPTATATAAPTPNASPPQVRLGLAASPDQAFGALIRREEEWLESRGNFWKKVTSLGSKGTKAVKKGVQFVKDNKETIVQVAQIAASIALRDDQVQARDSEALKQREYGDEQAEARQLDQSSLDGRGFIDYRLNELD